MSSSTSSTRGMPPPFISLRIGSLTVHMNFYETKSIIASTGHNRSFTQSLGRPVMLVPKANGSRRLCINYRKLNLVTVSDPYPIPGIEDMIDNVGRSRWITAIDLTKGYWQVPMEKTSQPKTAFVTPWGKYEFTTMPFGLVAAPSTFQQLTNNIFADTTLFASPHMDDIIIHSNTWTQHVEHLRAVFLRLQEAGLRINRRKCHFATNECEYLGHQVGYGKIRPTEAKVTAIKRFLQPRTKTDVRAFLGVCGNYRKFIPDFATIATLLSSATRKDEPNVIKWTAKQQAVFDTLKDRLVNYPVLRTPQWECELLLQTDISSTGLGYVLTQMDDYGEEHPLAYGSRNYYRER